MSQSVAKWIRIKYLYWKLKRNSVPSNIRQQFNYLHINTHKHPNDEMASGDLRQSNVKSLAFDFIIFFVNIKLKLNRRDQILNWKMNIKTKLGDSNKNILELRVAKSTKSTNHTGKID